MLRKKILQKDIDYKLKGNYSAKNVGVYDVEINFIGNYNDFETFSYKIIPQGTTVTSVDGIEEGISVTVEKQQVQTTGYQIQYSTSSDFSSPKTITSKDFSTLTQKVSGLKTDKKYYVRTRTYKKVGGQNIYSSWSASKSATSLYKASIKLNHENQTLSEGQSLALKATTVPSSLKITWKSSDTSVAKVNSNGSVSAVKQGKATITASIKYNNKTISKSCVITVKKPYVSLNKSSASIYIGDSLTVKASTYPSKQNVKWVTSNSSVAIVSSTGKITGKNGGTCTISSSFVYNKKTYKESCKITVKTPSIKLNKSSISIYSSKTTTLKATTAPTKQNVKWTTSNSSIATVSAGKVTGKRIGSCTVTAAFVYNKKTYKTSCKVSIKNILRQKPNRMRLIQQNHT